MDGAKRRLIFRGSLEPLHSFLPLVTFQTNAKMAKYGRFANNGIIVTIASIANVGMSVFTVYQ